jgi:omega-6 fatty acid desaturase (delta-12 desaturase)
MRHSPSELLQKTVPYAQENVATSWRLAGSAWLLLLACIVGVVVLPSWWMKALSSAGVAALMSRTFVIYHDYVHGAILKSSKFAKVLFGAYGLFCLAPVKVWKRTHEYHHRHNGRIFKPSIGTYPVFTKERYEGASKAERRSYLFQRHPAVIALGYWFTFLHGMCIQPGLVSPKRHWDSWLAVFLHVGYLSAMFLLAGWQVALLAIVLPNTLAFGFGAYLFYVQHNFPSVQYLSDGEWAYESSALKSSSFLDLSPVMHWITANIGYHHIHHLNARIPFYRLPDAKADIPELQHPLSSDLSWREVRRCLALKVWDDQRGRMVALAEI